VFPASNICSSKSERLQDKVVGFSFDNDTASRLFLDIYYRTSVVAKPETMRRTTSSNKNYCYLAFLDRERSAARAREEITLANAVWEHATISWINIACRVVNTS